MGNLNLLVIACLVMSMAFSNGEQPTVLNQTQLVELVTKYTVPYLQTKAKRDSLGETAAGELFGTITAFDVPLHNAERKLTEGIKAASKRSSQLSAMFRGINSHLRSSLEFFSSLKAQCPAITFGPEDAGEFIEINDDDPETVTLGDNEQDQLEEHFKQFKHEDLLTTGSEERIKAIMNDFGDHTVITLPDALKVFSMSARMCDESAALRLSNYLNKAAFFTAKLKNQMNRLEQIAELSASVNSLLNNFDRSLALELLTGVHKIKGKITSLVCQ